MTTILTSLLVLGAGAEPAAAKLDFERCGPKGFQCAKVKVPLDHGEPKGPKLSLAVTRRRASDRRRRVGALFVNYGGPGADAVEATQGFGRELLAPLTGRFDLIAVDPRGTGDSAPISCKVDQERRGVYRQPFVTPTTYDAAAEERRARAYAERCERRNRRIAAHLSTANVARDFDVVRDRLGHRKISYLGYSYGTLLGATYLKLFPQRARGFVLDGAVSPDGYLNAPLDHIREQTRGFEAALKRYLAACKRARSFCRWTGDRAPRAAYDALVRRADADPIPARSRRITRGHRQAVDGDTLNVAIVGDLYSKRLWPEMTIALNQAKRGDASVLRLLDDLFYDRKRNGSYGPGLDRYFMISASENQYPREQAIYASAGERAFAAFPHFFSNSGYAELNWGVYGPRDEDAYLGPFRLPQSVQTPLVVGTTFDPATTYRQTQEMTAALGNARLLTMRGDGHTAFGGNSRCIDRRVKRYLVKLELPGKGVKCRQNVPFPPRPQAGSASTSAGRAVGLPEHLRRLARR